MALCFGMRLKGKSSTVKLNRGHFIIQNDRKELAFSIRRENFEQIWLFLKASSNLIIYLPHGHIGSIINSLK